jgi:septum site-determining protein MinD
MSCKTIGIISIKGGVGKTTTSVNLANSLCKDFSKKVLLVDANFSSPNVGLHLGVMDHVHTSNTVLNDKSQMHEAIYEHSLGFHVLPASLKAEKVNPLKLKSKLQAVRKYYDFIVIDSSPSLNDEMLGTIMAADELFVVSTPDLPTLSTTLRAVKLAKEKNTPIIGLILNKVKGKSYELKLEDIEKAAGVPVIATLPSSYRVLEALTSVMPITHHSPLNDVSLEYKRLAGAICNESFNEPSKMAKFVSDVKEDFDNLKNHDFSHGLRYY